VAPFAIRSFGDPVLKQPCREITDIDDAVVRLASGMIETMYAAPGVGLAANQVGVQKRMFVYDVGDDTGPHTVINPVIVEASGDWGYTEGCLSVPELFWEIHRPMQVHLTGVGLDGEELSIEGEELLGRVFQHEVDHLDGILLLERLAPTDRKQAMRELRQRALSEPAVANGAAARGVAAPGG
jgi:peptide deformylase